MAWWAVLSHCIGLTSTDIRLPARLWTMIADGHGAVQVFMILSGFVITHLLVTKREPWARYMARRFFRIFPLYAACVTAAALLAPWQRAGLATISGASPFLATMAARFDTGISNPGVMLPVKFTMLHGLIPESWLANASGAYLGPGWSISTEWQFYLLAPACLALASRRVGAALFAGGIVAFGLFSRYFDNPAFVGKFAHLFLLGAVSAVAVVRAREDPGARPWVAAALSWGAGAVVAFVWALAPAWPTDAWPVTLWFLCLWAVVARHAAPAEPLGGVVRAFLGSGFLRLLGKFSYSTYLVHLPILLCLLRPLAGSATPAWGPGLFVKLVAIGFPTVFAASWLAFNLVEKPGIQFGRRCVELFTRAGTPPVPAR
jgi:peptidoglycan/LPS O-acetylase OafA/YrhL